MDKVDILNQYPTPKRPAAVPIEYLGLSFECLVYLDESDLRSGRARAGWYPGSRGQAPGEFAIYNRGDLWVYAKVIDRKTMQAEFVFSNFEVRDVKAWLAEIEELANITVYRGEETTLVVIG